MTPTPEEFSRRFGALWSARDAAGLAGLMADDADLISLTGLWAEGREAIAQAFEAELTGAFARSRLVTGRMKLRPLGPGAAVLHQRYVLSGLVDAEGRDMGRVAALLVATLIATAAGWQAVAASFTATDT